MKKRGASISCHEKKKKDHSTLFKYIFEICFVVYLSLAYNYIFQILSVTAADSSAPFFKVDAFFVQALAFPLRYPVLGNLTLQQFTVTTTNFSDTCL